MSDAESEEDKPVTDQPGEEAQKPAAAGWEASAPPAPPANCPPGLEYLLSIDQLLIKQSAELLEAFTGFETSNKYKKLGVEAPPGTPIGSVHQTCHILNLPRYDVKNASGETVLKIKGPLCLCNFCGDVEFEILSQDGETTVGRISKAWSGLAKELFTDADNFGVSFPLDMDVQTKATLLGAVFLIDFMYFEKRIGGKRLLLL